MLAAFDQSLLAVGRGPPPLGKNGGGASRCTVPLDPEFGIAASCLALLPEAFALGAPVPPFLAELGPALKIEQAQFQASEMNQTMMSARRRIFTPKLSS